MICTNDSDTYQEWGSLATFRNFSDAQSEYSAAHGLAILVFIKLAVQVQLEIYQLRRRKGDDNLTFVGGRADDRLARGYPPLIDTTVG